MDLPPRARAFGFLAAIGLAISTVLAALPASAASGPLVLRSGTDQALQVLNPWNSVVVADFEVFTLNYDLLVNFGQDLEPVPGFAESWSQSTDGKSWTFKIRPGMKWSDGQPATSEDALYTYQLVIDATKKSNASADGFYLGQGYLEPYLVNAGLKAVSAPDPETLVVETDFANALILQAYVPILPKHVWSKHTLEEIGNAPDVTPFTNEPPIVGTGPYQVVEWKTGDFIRFARNPNYWGEKGAADEVIIQHFGTPDTMVQALKTGAVDYVRGVLPDQFNDLSNDPGIVTVEGLANGYSELSFNTGGNKKGYGGSTSALSDIAFRDALGYAIDQTALVDATLGGYGTPGSTIIPPYHTRWHKEPASPRKFDLAEARRRLDAAGYRLDAQNHRLDKDGKPINLRLTWPDSESQHSTDAQFIADWFGQVGVTVEASVTEEGALIDAVTGPPNGPANYDIYIWGWVGDPDPTSLLNFFRTDEIGASSDSYYSNPKYDALFLQQRAEADPVKRKALLGEMQDLVYAEAPYHILYYDSELDAYRTDKFGGWVNQPSTGGTPLFGYGSFGYTKLTDVNAVPTPGPSAASGAPTPAPSGSGQPAGSSSNSTLLLVLGIFVLVVILAVGIALMRRRGTVREEE